MSVLRLPRRMAGVRPGIARPGVDWDRVLVFARAFVVIAFFLYPVWWIHVHFVSATVPEVPLSLAISFLGVQFAVIIGELLASSAAKKLDEIRLRRSRHWHPRIRSALAAYLAAPDSAGKHGCAELQYFRKRHPRETETCLVEMLAAVNGQARQRLSELAVTLKLTGRWEKHAGRGRLELREAIEWLGLLSMPAGRAALLRVLEAASSTIESRWLPRHASPSTLASTYCAKIRLASAGDLSQICQEVLAAPFLVRAMAASDLRAHAHAVGAAAGTASLSSHGSRSSHGSKVALQLAESWRRNVDTPGLAALLQHESSTVRGLALRLIPFQGTAGAFDKAILEGLQGGTGPVDADDAGADEMRTGALSAVGRLRMTRALPLVAECSASANESLARLACATLAELGEVGREVLESQIHGAPPDQSARGGARAAEALMSVSTGRLTADGF